MTRQQTEFYCSTCGHRFESEEALLAHKVDGALRQEDMVHCAECDGFFESDDAFRDHLQSTHLRRA
jgi:DNA-directed RNA polymerase subunit RPC12/RpoP